jgi:hypothetical protein
MRQIWTELSLPRWPGPWRTAAGGRPQNQPPAGVDLSIIFIYGEYGAMDLPRTSRERVGEAAGRRR